MPWEFHGPDTVVILHRLEKKELIINSSPDAHQGAKSTRNCTYTSDVFLDTSGCRVVEYLVRSRSPSSEQQQQRLPSCRSAISLGAKIKPAYMKDLDVPVRTLLGRCGIGAPSATASFPLTSTADISWTAGASAVSPFP